MKRIVATTIVLLSMLAATPASAHRATSGAASGTLTVSPTHPADMADFTVSGAGFAPGHTYLLRLTVGIGGQDVTTDGAGTFTSAPITATVTDTDYTADLYTATGRLVASLTFPVGTYRTCVWPITETVTVSAPAGTDVIARDNLTGCGGEAIVDATGAITFADTQCPVLLYAEAFAVDTAGNLTPVPTVSVACA